MNTDPPPPQNPPTSQTNTSHRKHKPSKKLKIMTTNCRSMRSNSKKTQFQSLVDTDKPEIIIGTESYLDNNIYSKKIFPPTYEIIRKYRNLHGGGVFIAITDTIVASLQPNPSSDAEMLWVKFQFINRKPPYIGAFHHPPDSGGDMLDHLQPALSKLQQTCASNTLPSILFGGDFNLPSIDWTNHSLRIY